MPRVLQLPLPELPEVLQRLVAAGDAAAFANSLASARKGGGWGPLQALQQAHGALQLGLLDQADQLVVEADALQPTLALVPDRWGLWPIADAPQSSPQLDLELAHRCVQLRDQYLQLRHQPALDCWRQWLLAVQPRWQAAAEAPQLALMGLLLGRLEQLPAPLEPAVEQLIGEEQVAADPAAALAIWAPLCRRLPQWTYARLKAADLSLQLQQLSSCAELLGAATAEQRQLPWLLDIEARLAMAQQHPRAALAAWEEAIRLAGSQGDAELAELFRQRRREAEWDAEWMAESPALVGATGDMRLDAFSGNLERWAQRAGVELTSTPAAAGEADPEAFAAFLVAASGRLALAG